MLGPVYRAPYLAGRLPAVAPADRWGCGFTLGDVGDFVVCSVDWGNYLDIVAQ